MAEVSIRGGGSEPAPTIEPGLARVMGPWLLLLFIVGDCEAAGDEVEKHIENGRDRFIRAMSATGQLVLKEGATGQSSRRRA